MIWNVYLYGVLKFFHVISYCILFEIIKFILFGNGVSIDIIEIENEKEKGRKKGLPIIEQFSGYNNTYFILSTWSIDQVIVMSMKNNLRE